MNFIAYKPYTRFGNWLFQIAFARLFEKPIAYYANPKTPFTMLEKYHEQFSDIVFTHDLPDDVVIFDDINLVQNNYCLPSQHDNLFLKGYFQYPEVLDRKKCIRDFACPSRIQRIIDEKYGNILAQPLVISIHVRRGDYIKLPQSYPFVGKTYLKKAVYKFPKSSQFIICSDDIPWCKSFFTEQEFEGRKFIFSENSEMLVDFYLQTFCHHNIISNSTFSWWAAFLNEHDARRVVFPSMWWGIARKKYTTHLYTNDAEIIQNHYTPLQYCHALALCGKKIIGDTLRSFGYRKHDINVIPKDYL